MENNLLFNAGCSIYPGEYVPLFKEDEINEKLSNFPGGKSFVPLQTVKELATSYEIEVDVPGVKRENFILKVDGHILSVFVIQNEGALSHNESIQAQPATFDCFKHQIILPENADPVFTSAEYKAGVLRLHVSKSNRPVKNLNTRIAIY